MCLSFCFIVNSYTHCLTEKCVLTTKDKWMFSSKEIYVTHVKCVLNLWGGVTSICTSLVSLWNHLTAGNQWPLRVIVCHCECEYPFLKRIQWKTVRQAGASHALTLRLWPKAQRRSLQLGIRTGRKLKADESCTTKLRSQKYGHRGESYFKLKIYSDLICDG